MIKALWEKRDITTVNIYLDYKMHFDLRKGVKTKTWISARKCGGRLQQRAGDPHGSLGGG